MPASLAPPDRQFLEQLHRLGTATIQDLCSANGVTATAIRQRLARLEAWGFVRKDVVRHGRGRPHNAYSVTDAALRKMGDNYAGLALLLWRVLTHIEDERLRREMFSQLRSALVDEYSASVSGATVLERLRQLQQVLTGGGFDVELEPARAPGSLPILRENNCPWHDLASRDAAICDLEQAVFSELVGADVALTACCRNGHSCCEFQVAGDIDS
jgi:predicted ArsR family transcriptional regulator